MKIIYKDWEQDKGYEEEQAKIYNENNPGPQAITSKQIIERYKNEKIDPKTVKYAFNTFLFNPIIFRLKNNEKEIQIKLINNKFINAYPNIDH